MLRLGAVHANHFQSGMVLGKHPCTFRNGVALMNMMPVLAGKANPVIRSHLLCNFRFNQSLLQRGLCFNQENICACVPENLHSFLMKCTQGFIGYAIIPAVFRTIRKICAVRPDSCQTKRIHAPLRLALRVPPFLSRF